MKKALLLGLMITLFYSCDDREEFTTSKNDNFKTNSLTFKKPNYQLEEKITIAKTTSKISKLFLNLGVVKVKVTDRKKWIEYSFSTKKMFGINGEGTDFKNYKIILNDGMIRISSNSNVKLTIFENQPYIITPTYAGFLKSGAYIDDKDFNLLYLFMNELITPETSKTDASGIGSGGCSFENTHYVYATGGSASVAEANLPGEIAHYTNGFNTLDLSKCNKFGGVDTSCVWGNHLCISTQAFCCN